MVVIRWFEVRIVANEHNEWNFVVQSSSFSGVYIIWLENIKMVQRKQDIMILMER